MSVSQIRVYKNEDINNPEYATMEEVRRAFFGRGIFIKHTDGMYERVLSFNSVTGIISTNFADYIFIQPK